ncbi:MAG: pyridoxal-phosphate dependent enzyme [Phycisphaerae bacterium]|jgi:threonine synthase
MRDQNHEVAEDPAQAADDSVALLDNATSQPVPIPGDLKEQIACAGDSSALLDTRLEAYEDITDSQVGDTALSRARNIERQVDLRQIYLKFEGGNPSGTQKDRIAFAQTMDALRRGYDAVTVATCGNYGVAVAMATSLAGLRCILYIPRGYSVKRMKEIETHSPEVVRVDGDYESAVTESRERAEAEEIYDANPGGANTALQLRAYGEIAHEIYDELRDAPAAIAVPVSNGTTLAGIYRGFLSLHRRGKTSRMPRMIAGSSFGKNPIVRSFRKNVDGCSDLAPERIRETRVNEPLINWHSIDGHHALEAIRATNGWASDASDRGMLAYSKLLREREGLSVLPASTAGLIALTELHQREPLTGDRYVAVLTGKK